jgi:hypothetical protein
LGDPPALLRGTAAWLAGGAPVASPCCWCHPLRRRHPSRKLNDVSTAPAQMSVG